MTDFLHWIWWISWWLSLLTVPSVLVQRAGRPSTALSWILALFILPPIVLPGWWLVGRTHLRVRRRRRLLSKSMFEEKLRAQRDSTEESAQATKTLLDIVSLPEDLKNWVYPPTAGNHVTLLKGGANAFDAWEIAFARARRHIHLQFYVWRDDSTGRRFRDVLVDAARRGVEVRLMVDAIGTRVSMRFFKPLTEAGGRVEKFLPLQLRARPATLNFRNHRKLIIIDGNEAFVGGMNVGDEYLAWLDLAVKIRGPGVDQVQEIFCDDWYYVVGEDLSEHAYFGLWASVDMEPQSGSMCSCAIIAGGPHQRLNAISETMMLAMSDARKHMWIMTPYFVPDIALTQVLRLARYRGVDVRVVVPSKSNWPLVRRASRAYYPELLNAGVRIYEYNGMLHAKASVIDNQLVCIGSANLDQRSFRLNFELSCFLESSELNGECKQVFENTFNQSTEIVPESFNRRPWFTKAVDAALHLFSPVLQSF